MEKDEGFVLGGKVQKLRAKNVTGETSLAIEGGWPVGMGREKREGRCESNVSKRRAERLIDQKQRQKPV